MNIRQAIIALILVGFTLIGTVAHLSAANHTTSTEHSRHTVIIALRHTIAPESEVMARSAVATRRMQIRLLQDRFVATSLRSATDVISLQTMPVIVATVDDATLARLQQSPEVSSVYVSRILRQFTSESTSQIGARAVNASGVTGVGTSVAVLDTGVDGKHPALQGQIIQEACFSTTDDTYGSTSVCAGGSSMQVGVGSGVPCDITIDACQHGTHVAGIIAGKVITQDGITTRGVAPDAHIIAVQVFSRFAADHPAAMCGIDATSDCVFAYEHDLLRALDWLYVQNDGAGWGTLAAVNMSLGDGSFSEACDTLGGSDVYPFKWYIDQLRTIGVATVVAAGNSASPTGVAYPACVSSAISVGSVSSTNEHYGWRDRPSAFSNAPTMFANTPNGRGDRLLDFYAPGERIRSSVTAQSGATFVEYSGTSMAAPHVSGAWALLKSLRRRASVPLVRTWLDQTGEPIVETRDGFDPALRVPRIDVAHAMDVIRALSSPVRVSNWSIDMGDVQVGRTLRQRITIDYSGVPATLRLTLSGRYFRLEPVACEGFVDDLTPQCVVDVVYAPPSAVTSLITNASVRLEVNRLVYTIGLTGRAVSVMPEAARTQTAVVQATQHALMTRTATPTLWPTPSALASAKTVIAVATRTQRRRDEVAVTATHRTGLLNQTMTQIAVSGGATVTPSATPTASRTRTPIAITQTIVRARTATQRMNVRITQTARIAATRTQSSYTRATVRANAAAQTATHISASGLSTYTPTKTTRPRRTLTVTRTPTSTALPPLTRTPTVAYITTNGQSLYKRYQALVRSPLGTKSLALYAGDYSKSRVPELIIVDPTLQRTTSTLRLPGMDATALTSVVNKMNQFVVAGRLNWNSYYIQVYEVRNTRFVLRNTYIAELPPGSTITALYATDQRIIVALAHQPIPSAHKTGQLVVLERLPANQFRQLAVTTDTLAGVATSIRALDNADDFVIIAGYVPGSTPSGFVQSYAWDGTGYAAKFVSPRTQPVLDIATYSILSGLKRVHLVFGAQKNGLMVLQFDEANGVLAQYLATLPIVATNLDQSADQLAVIGFDQTLRRTVTSVYQWSVNRLQLRRTITHVNRDGGIIGIAFYGSQIVFADTDWLRFSR